MKNQDEHNMKPKKRQHITIDDLRTCKGFENVSEEEANNIINSIKELSILLCYMMKNGTNNDIHNIDNQHNTIIFEQNRNKKAA